MILTNWTWTALSRCISGEPKFELLDGTKITLFLPLYIPSEYFLCHNSQGGNVVHLLTWDDKEEGFEALPDAAVQEPRGVCLVNIDKRQQHVLTRDLCLPLRLSLGKVAEMSGLAPLWIHWQNHWRAVKPELQRIPAEWKAHRRLPQTFGGKGCWKSVNQR